MPQHEVLRFVNGLSEKLASRSRHVCVFTGAGASRACGLPDVAQLTEHVRDELVNDELVSFERLLKNGNLEQVLSRLRRISSLLDGSEDKVDGLTDKSANDLDVKICRVIVSKLAVDQANILPILRFASWAGRANYHQALEVFTVNYDLIIETGLEYYGVPYFDGFVGTLRGRFRSDLVDGVSYEDRESLPSFVVRLWKLHGSVHWAWSDDERPTVVRLGAPVPDNKPAAIYPSDAKYDESRRAPFVVLQDRFRRALEQPETLTLITGYAFGDQHLNEIIFDAARRRPRSEFVVFCYGEISNDLAEVAKCTPNLQVVSPTEAIISGLRDDWKSPDEAPVDVWADGKFMLGDFDFLSQFLSRSSPNERDFENLFGELLSRTVKPGA